MYLYSFNYVVFQPVNSVKGHFVPGGLAKFHRHRRVSIEVHRVLPTIAESVDDAMKKEDAKKDSAKDKKSEKKEDPSAAKSSILGGLIGGGDKDADGTDPSKGYEDVFVRILVPASPREVRAAQEAAEKVAEAVDKVAKDTKKAVGEGLDKAAETVGGPGGNLLAHDDDSLMPTKMTTVNSMPGRTASTRTGMQHGAVIDTIPENGQGTMHVAPPPAANAHWLEKYRFPLRDVHVKKRVSNSVVLHTKLGELEQTREIIFETAREAIDFCAEMEEHHRIEEIRSKKRLKAALGGIKLKDGGGKEKIKFLIEVVSGTELPAADITSSDPMVKIIFNGKEVHKTKFISSTLEPVWTIKQDSLCLFTVTVQDLFDSHEGVTFLVQDFDKFGGNETLGAVVVPPREVFLAKGERVEYPLKALFGHKDYGTGKLALRIRRATDYDIDFMEKWSSSQKEDLIVKTTATKGGKGTIGSIVTRNEKVGKFLFMIPPYIALSLRVRVL